MTTKFNALIKNNTWTLVPRSPNFYVIGCKWVFKLKHKPDGTIDIHKGRLVAKGSSQQEGFDFSETFNLVVKITSIHILVSLTINLNWSIHQLDVLNAFFHGDISELIYMKQLM
ncbi:unnamed protein product [Spirodela intermedia]|uniref:Reverse transcriptase Ty1/copia-type domain-containing protein n=1 Tax=Spirodela intermedia TaxID=51605 RepID=A0A7I8KEA0_SPIIN|nr:unnamed protein product [Spirodela intermedia]